MNPYFKEILIISEQLQGKSTEGEVLESLKELDSTKKT
jgi:hypothetical protein